MGMSRQSLSNKFYRDSFSADDLIKVTDFLRGELALTVDDVKILLDESDLRQD